MLAWPSGCTGFELKLPDHHLHQAASAVAAEVTKPLQVVTFYEGYTEPHYGRIASSLPHG